MKTTILIKDKRKQLVLEPENEVDKEAVKLFGEAKVGLYEKYLGEFYDCQGGWTRQSANSNSLIIVFKEGE
jgi:hypothetical protein